MSASSKRLDLRFGAFACSVQGFDNPVEPVQQFLRALQHLLEETPELADAGISFDAEAIEQLIGEVARRADLAEDDIEIVPGLVIIRHGESTGAGTAADTADSADEDEAWEDPFAADDDGASEEPEADQAGGFRNIFTPAAEPAEASRSDFEELASALGKAARGDTEALFTARLGSMAQGGAPEEETRADIFAADNNSDGGVFFDPMADDDAEEPDDEALNLFADDDRQAGAEPPGKYGNVFATFESRSRVEADGRAAPEGDAAGEPERVAEPEGYTAAGLAEAAGATAINDLMASAAAYMVLIQGQTTFSRREVLDIFDSLPGDHEKTLEARIKGFGKAVRNGQFVAVDDGVFGLSQGEVNRFEALL